MKFTEGGFKKWGYELAERLLHGEHAFIVATHTDRKHIHNHIVFCATALDCSHKFRNVWNSSRLVAEISDELCREHHLSVVQNPQNKTVSYEKWEGDQSKLTSRDSLRITIDTALRKIFGDELWRRIAITALWFHIHIALCRMLSVDY